MNKAKLVQRVAEGTGLTQVEVAAVVEGVLEVISGELERGGRLEIRGFGTFKPEKRAARDAVNPRTGERIRVPEKLTVVFRPAAGLKERLNR